MTTFNSVEEAREFFKNDKFAAMLDIGLDELDEDSCECSLKLNDNHRNAVGGVMGGVMFTLADFSFAVLSNNIHSPTVAQQVSINYLSAPKGSKLIANAVCKKNGRSSCIINVDIVDDTGRDIVQFVGTGFKLGTTNLFVGVTL